MELYGETVSTTETEADGETDTSAEVMCVQLALSAS